MLTRDATRIKNQAFAASTNNNMKTHLRAYLLFCVYFAFTPFPVSPAQLEQYIVFLSRTFKTVQAIKLYVHTIKFHHQLRSLPFPPVNSHHISLLLRGLKRVLFHLPHPVLPISPHILLKIFSVLNLRNPFHATMWACFLLSFFLLARKSNMLPPSTIFFDQVKQLTRAKVRVAPNGLLVQFFWTKTVQFGQEVLSIPLASFPNSPLCPLQAYTHMCRLNPSPLQGPAFVYRQGQKVVPVTQGLMIKFLRQCLQKVGIPPHRFSSHSFRHGGTQFLFSQGVSPQVIQTLGHWKSDAYLRYLSISLPTKFSVSKSLYPSIQKITAEFFSKSGSFN